LDVAKSGGAGPILHKAVLIDGAQCPDGLFTPNEAFDVFPRGDASGLSAAGLAMDKVETA